jgi:nucleotidyltransferase/DNA polymerase involved in DNA repair
VSSFVFHVDLDQFLAAVEMLRRPELRGRPVIVGGDGDPTKRGVVSTASYEARAFGVGSGMPLRTALKRCPDAVFLLARQIQQRVLERTELWCSIGIGDNKLQAKIATDAGKPAGVFLLTSDRWSSSMGPRGTDALWGIGTKTARKLAAIGIGTVDELAAADLDELAAAFGPSTGPWLAQLARGENPSPVSDAPWIPKGVSRERTFQKDLATADDIERELNRLAFETSEDVRKDGRAAVRVVVKLRLVPFITKTRGALLPGPTSDPDAIAAGARAALARFPEIDRPVRLLGVRAEFEQDRPSGEGGGLGHRLLDIQDPDADD